MSGSREERRLLMVDDDVILLEVLAKVIESRGYIVDQACRLSVAMDRIARSRYPYRLIILDSEMPDEKQEDFANLLSKSSPCTVLVYSGLPPRDYLDARISFLQKGPNPRELFEAIDRLFASAS